MQPEIASHCHALADLSKPRVWSLLVTIFGDLAAEEGAVVPGPALSRIMLALDIRPEATRVALHRLRREGWITSQRSGRASLYALSKYGRAETLQASRRIYAAPDTGLQDWHVIALGPDETEAEMHTRGFFSLGNRLYVGDSELSPPPSAWRLTGRDVPDWVMERLAPALFMEEYKALEKLLADTEATLCRAAPLSALERAVLRCLIVHAWRRLVLRHPALPAPLHPDGWRAPACLDRVHRLLKQLSRPALTEL